MVAAGSGAKGVPEPLGSTPSYCWRSRLVMHSRFGVPILQAR
jgi:hypothetical protein